MLNIDKKDYLTEQLKPILDSYGKNRSEYLKKTSDFDEAETRSNFLDPLFLALGWDVFNAEGKSPGLQQVRREKGPTLGQPDYTFYSLHESGYMTPSFFVEAKRPSEKLSHWKHVYQARRYAFSAARSTLVIVVLTNFEETRIYRVDSEPYPDDDPEEGLLFRWSYTSLISRLDDLLQLEKDNVRAGSLLRLVRHGTVVEQRPPVEQPFLRRLEKYRSLIASSLLAENATITELRLNSAVETILNRLVFLRFAEDRRIIPEEDLLQTVKQWRRRPKGRLIEALRAFFQEMDVQFNGRLFSTRDDLCDVSINDELLEEIVTDLYPPHCPYAFNQLQIDMLGDIYEQHLGKFIEKNDRGLSIIERPEVRHAKGVYYTPRYITLAILQRTLAPALRRCSSIDEVLELRIIDPACGSGSFLLAAFEMIQDDVYTRARFDDNFRQYLDVNSNGDFRLKLAYKRSILDRCLCGIDVDPRAIRVAELSLYLSLLDDEPKLAGSPRPLLPKLEKNLQCGNSLIDTTMISGELNLAEKEDDILDRVNPLTWESRGVFSTTMKRGGFDVVVGNPPYIRIQSLSEFSPVESKLVKKFYRQVSKGCSDLYVAFMYRAVQKLRAGGTFGFIVSNKFMSAKYGEGIRQYLGENTCVKFIADFRRQQVFHGAMTYTCVLVAEKSQPSGVTDVRIIDVRPERRCLEDNILPGVKKLTVNLSLLKGQAWTLDGEDTAILQPRAGFTKLGDLCHIFQGLRTSDDHVFVLTKALEIDGFVRGFSRALNEMVTLEKAVCRTFLKGRQIGRNILSVPDRYLLFPYEGDNSDELICLGSLKSNFPLVHSYLLRCEKRLRARQKGKFNQEKWWGFIYLKNHGLVEKPKLLIRSMAPRAHLALDRRGGMSFSSAYGIIIRSSTDPFLEEQYMFLHAVLKSSYVDKAIIARASPLQAGTEYRKQFLCDLMIPIYQPENPSHQRIVDAQRACTSISAKIFRPTHSDLGQRLVIEISELETQIDEVVSNLYKEAGTTASI